MRKLFYSILIPVSLVLIFLASCKTDDNNDYEVSEEWKDYQAKVYSDITKDIDYTQVISQGIKGNVYYKDIDSVTVKAMQEPIFDTRMGKDGKPYFNDTVQCRYTGWYYNLNGKKIQFDSSESINGSYKPFQTVVGEGVIAGWTTMLQEMTEGQTVQVCIPHTLAYGMYGSGTIPGYTTLFFRLRLVKIKAINKEEVEEWNKTK